MARKRRFQIGTFTWSAATLIQMGSNPMAQIDLNPSSSPPTFWPTHLAHDHLEVSSTDIEALSAVTLRLIHEIWDHCLPLPPPPIK
jgi:hypothetical protein